MSKIKVRRPPDNYGFYYRNELWFSDSYQELTKSAMNLLHSFVNELKYNWYKKEKIYENNGELSFTENQFKGLYDSSSDTYLRARNQLIKNGLITQTYQGGYGKGDRSRYKLLFVEGVPFREQRWQEYSKKKNWEHEIPRMKDSLIGKSTRFTPGRKGQK